MEMAARCRYLIAVCICRSFAAVSVSMQTYDRLVVYSPRQSADAHVSQPSTAHASSSSERHLSSSQERCACERSQQPARSSREPSEHGARHVQSRPASVEAQPDSSTARQGHSAKGRDDVGASEDREPHTSSYRKRRRFSSRQPSAEPDDRGSLCNGHHQPSERSHEAIHEAQCLSERSQGVSDRCNESGSSRPSSAALRIDSPGAEAGDSTRALMHWSRGCSIKRLESVYRKAGSESHGEAKRLTSPNSQMLAELREKALAALRAHREHV